MTSQVQQDEASSPSEGGAAPPADRVPAPVQAPRERRARLVVRRLDPWSMLKFSLLFYFCLLLVGVLVFAAVWLVLNNMGVFAGLSDLSEKTFGSDFILTFDAGTVFRWYIGIGLGGVVFWSVATVLLTLLFNLVNDITGGVEVVLAESERRRQR
jgi:Transmembrane domain of unknown function (DUF3566)